MCVFVAAVLLLGVASFAQDASTSAIRGIVSDTHGARIAGASVAAINTATGVTRATATSSEGVFSLQMLPPDTYEVRVSAPGMAIQSRTVRLEIGAELNVHFDLALAGAHETVTVTAGEPMVQTQPSAISNVLDERAIQELPLNGRRFTDLALLTPGVTQDPRGLTSAGNGDLAFGGVRGYHTNFRVDGADNNNAFFSQARGRYRAPYQFSNEVIQEFRVSSNTYGAELGRSGGAVINVVTKSGSNYTHGSAFYYLRDKNLNAQPALADIKPAERQHQFGFTAGGPIIKNRLFYYGGFDQHIFHVPTMVRFVDGLSVITPVPGRDYEACDPAIGGPACDQALVTAAAARLSTQAGNFRSTMVGSAAFFKLDYSISPRHYLAARVNTSRYNGQNNVFLDPASPITFFGISSNGTEDVNTESAVISLTSALSMRATSHLRVQFSHELQASTANSPDPLVKIYGISDGFGRSSILPRHTGERRVQVAETVTLERNRHSWKFGGDVNLTWIRNFFPSMFGGEYIFDNVKVDKWSFVPQPVGGLELSPLRAYAHGIPRYYMQSFGTAASHPDTQEYAWFIEDSLRVSLHLAIKLGLRYDLQTFRSDRLQSNPLWPDSGKLPLDTNNFAPRLGFAYSIGDQHPLVLRGGYGWFYTRIPQIYNSAIETNNGLAHGFLFLDNATKFPDQQIFPAYPAPLVACPPASATCIAPANVAGLLSSDVSAFAANFQTPMVQQASLSVEREVADRFAVGASYLYVRGEHLIRARDVNLPPPTLQQYPVFDGDTFTGDYWNVYSFDPSQSQLARPIPQLGSINLFESAATSIYHGLTLSVRRRMTHGLYFRLAYTWAHAIDTGQDALLTSSSTVQNSYATASERGPSVTDQRHRFVFSWMATPRPFHRDHPWLARICNNWRFSGVVTIGSGRPVNARIMGDANQDGNSYNDRLPGAGRNSFLGPGYATTDLRIARRLHTGDRMRVEALLEAFNVFNRDNLRVDISDDAFLNSAAKFVRYSTTAGGQRYPAYYQRSSNFLQPTSAYAPRQVQLALKLLF